MKQLKIWGTPDYSVYLYKFEVIKSEAKQITVDVYLEKINNYNFDERYYKQCKINSDYDEFAEMRKYCMTDKRKFKLLLEDYIIQNDEIFVWIEKDIEMTICPHCEEPTDGEQYHDGCRHLTAYELLN